MCTHSEWTTQMCVMCTHSVWTLYIHSVWTTQYVCNVYTFNMDHLIRVLCVHIQYGPPNMCVMCTHSVWTLYIHSVWTTQYVCNVYTFTTIPRDQVIKAPKARFNQKALKPHTASTIYRKKAPFVINLVILIYKPITYKLHT